MCFYINNKVSSLILQSNDLRVEFIRDKPMFIPIILGGGVIYNRWRSNASYVYINIFIYTVE